MTNQELIAEIRKPGKIEMPVLSTHDVIYVIVEKGDLIATIEKDAPSAQALWCFVNEYQGIRRLDIQD